MIALSPDRLSWQKTTCSWSARPVPPGDCAPGPDRSVEPFSLVGIPNTFVTVATLLVSSRLPVEPDPDPSVSALTWASLRTEAGGPRQPDAYRTGR